MKKKRALLAGLALGLATITIGGPAFADIYSYYYNVTMPVGQAPRNTGVQTKTVNKQSGTITPYSISGGYKIDAVMCAFSGLSCTGGTKVYNIPADGIIHYLPNTYSAGNARAINIQPSTWNGGDVTSTGYSSVK